MKVIISWYSQREYSNVFLLGMRDLNEYLKSGGLLWLEIEIAAFTTIIGYNL